MTEPTARDLADPMFVAVWAAIKPWDIERTPGQGYAHATGTDVMTIMDAIREIETEPDYAHSAAWRRDCE